METQAIGPEQTRHGRHLWRNPVLPSPQQLRHPSNAFDAALQLLWPIDLHKHAAACLGIAGALIRDWRRRNRAPQWAIDRIATELENRRAKIAAALEALAKEKGRG